MLLTGLVRRGLFYNQAIQISRHFNLFQPALKEALLSLFCDLVREKQAFDEEIAALKEYINDLEMNPEIFTMYGKLILEKILANHSHYSEIATVISLALSKQLPLCGADHLLVKIAKTGKADRIILDTVKNILINYKKYYVHAFVFYSNSNISKK